MRSLRTASTAIAVVLAFTLGSGCTTSDPPRPERPSAPAVAPALAPPSASASAAASAASTPPIPALDQIKHDAIAVGPLLTTPFAHRFAGAAAALPHVAPRTLFRTHDKQRWFTTKEAAALAPAERAALDEVKVDDELYYMTNYGTPVSYARAIDLLAQAKVLPEHGKILDFGYGYVGHLRMLASLGFDATGVDVNPMLRPLYAEAGDQGPVPGVGGERSGTVRLLGGRFPADAEIKRAVGTGYDVIISKNTLKRGYIHPERKADPKYLVHLDVDDATFLRAMHDALKPHGAMMIYNVCPAPTPPDKPFVPWSDGRSPWTPEQWKAANFEVLVFDRDETATFRAFGKALEWDKGEDAMDLEHDLSVLYTLVRRVD